MGRKITFLAILLVLGIFAGGGVSTTGAIAQESNKVFNNSGLPIPRFVSLRSDKVFVRTGPALRYPIKWIYTKDNLPVEIVQEFDTWRKIRGIEGDEGWIHQSLLAGKRYGVVQNPDGAHLMRKPQSDAQIKNQPVALIEENVVIELLSCSGAWCEASASGFQGWMERKFIWGVYAQEELD